MLQIGMLQKYPLVSWKALHWVKNKNAWHLISLFLIIFLPFQIGCNILLIHSVA